MKALVVEGVFHWGFSVRIPGTSAGGATYPTIPPSTIIGALSRGWCSQRGYAVRNGHSCTEDFYNLVRTCIIYKNNYPGIFFAAHSPYSIYSDILKQEGVIYRQKKYRNLKQKKSWFGISAFGKAYAPHVRFKIFLLMADCSRELVRQLEATAWNITSLGAKESIVSIYKVEQKDLINVNDAKVYVYIPEPCLSQHYDFEIVELPTSNMYNLQSTASNVGNIFAQPRRYALPTLAGIYGVSRHISKSQLQQSCGIWKDNTEGIVYYT